MCINWEGQKDAEKLGEKVCGVHANNRAHKFYFKIGIHLLSTETSAIRLARWERLREKLQHISQKDQLSLISVINMEQKEREHLIHFSVVN